MKFPTPPKITIPARYPQKIGLTVLPFMLDIANDGNPPTNEPIPLKIKNAPMKAVTPDSTYLANLVDKHHPKIPPATMAPTLTRLLTYGIGAKRRPMAAPIPIAPKTGTIN